MNNSTVAFDAPDLLQQVLAMANEQLDDLEMGIIGFDADYTVRQYNRYESAAAALSKDRVVGHHVFTAVAPCMNNFMVAQRFEDAQVALQPLDATIDYVLTLRMRPTRVRLRLLAGAGTATRYIVVQRSA